MRCETSGEENITESFLRAFDEREFVLFVQFIVDAKTEKVVRAEALSRWNRGEKGIVAPGKYIWLMEENGLIGRHDLYMFELVCKQLQEWKETSLSDVPLSCNFTRVTLSEKGVVEKIKAICEKYDFDRSKVCIEITEEAIEKNVENALSNIEECKKLGFRIALDDLGNGYTSLSNLCDYPIDIVKIDRDILLKADTERGRALLEGIVELAHKLKLKVVCEGIETEEQKEVVVNAGCDYIQGFYYFRPMPKEEYEKIMCAD
ncbi:MAG: EAL domain-containing protein [Oscillospiraceae bacterium]|nr:EAL domain-containing protein [Oscillospiraceae bacterium]